MRWGVAGAEVGNHFSGTNKCGTDHRPCKDCPQQECEDAPDNCDWNLHTWKCTDKGKDYPISIQAFRDGLKKKKKTRTITVVCL